VVTISFDIESREFNGRWYTSIRAYRIVQGDVTQQGAATPAPAAPAQAAPSTNNQPPVTNEQQLVAPDPFDAGDGTSDLPF
jgi:hypothetical protein